MQIVGFEDFTICFVIRIVNISFVVLGIVKFTTYIVVRIVNVSFVV